MSINEKEIPKFFGFRINNTVMIILFFISINGIINRITPLYSWFNQLLHLGEYTITDLSDIFDSIIPILVEFGVTIILLIIFLYIILRGITLKKIFKEKRNYQKMWFGFNLTRTAIPILIFFSIINLINYSCSTYLNIVTLRFYSGHHLGSIYDYILIERILSLVLAPFLIAINIYTLIICLICRET